MTTKLTWQRLANGDLLCREYPIRLVKPISRRPDDPGWVVRVPATRDTSYDHLDGWQWTSVLDKGSEQLETNTLPEAKTLVGSTVYLEYIRGWIPAEYGKWTAERRQAFVDEAQATADKFPALYGPKQPRPAQPAKRAAAGAAQFSVEDPYAKPGTTSDPYEAIGYHRPNVHGWPVLMELSSRQFEALLEISGKVTEGDLAEHARPLREIHSQLVNLDPRRGRRQR